MSPVIVYSSNTCPNCDNLKKVLAMKSIPYQEINIVEQPDAAVILREKGYRQLPVINDNENWMSGFTPMNLTKIIQQHAQPAHPV